MGKIITGNKNDITRETLAKIRRFIIGNVAFVNSRDGLNFDSVVDGDSVTVGRGLIYAYGYAAYSKDPVSFKFVRANTEQYWFIYAELNLSEYPNELKIKRVNNGRSTDRTFRQDVLSSETSGVYQRPLWRVHVTNTGVTDIEDVRLLGDYIIDRSGGWTQIISLLIPEYVYTKYTFNNITGEISTNENDKISKDEMNRGKTYYHSTAYNRITEYYVTTDAPPSRYARTCHVVRSDGGYECNSKIYKVNIARNAKNLEGMNAIIDNGVVVESTPPLGDNSNKVATTEFVIAEIDSYM